MANSDHKGDGAPPSKVHVGPATKKKSILPWILLGLGLLALLFGLRRCNDDEAVTRVETTQTTTTAPVADTAVAPAPVTAPATGSTAVLAGTSGLGS